MSGRLYVCEIIFALLTLSISVEDGITKISERLLNIRQIDISNIFTVNTYVYKLNAIQYPVVYVVPDLTK